MGIETASTIMGPSATTPQAPSRKREVANDGAIVVPPAIIMNGERKERRREVFLEDE